MRAVTKVMGEDEKGLERIEDALLVSMGSRGLRSA
jgi:hypothetical protein